MSTNRSKLAHALFESAMHRPDGSLRWPNLSVHEITPKFSAEHWYIPNLFVGDHWPNIELLCENRVVMLHGNKGDGGGMFLAKCYRALDREMRDVGHTVKAYQGWSDHGFRFGYKFTTESKGLLEEMRFSIMMGALIALTDAANAFAEFEEKRRRSPPLHIRNSVISRELDDLMH